MCGWLEPGGSTGVICTSSCGRDKHCAQAAVQEPLGTLAARGQAGHGTESPRFCIFKPVGQTDGAAPEEAEDAPGSPRPPRPLKPAVAFRARFSAGNETRAAALPTARPAPTRGWVRPGETVLATVKTRSSCRSRDKAGTALPWSRRCSHPPTHATPRGAEQESARGTGMELPLNGLVRTRAGEGKLLGSGPDGTTCAPEGRLQNRVPACFVPAGSQHPSGASLHPAETPARQGNSHISCRPFL